MTEPAEAAAPLEAAEVPVFVPRREPFYTLAVQKAATLLAIELRGCPGCARPGELCTQGIDGDPDWRKTHMDRFAGLGSPVEFLTAHDRLPPGNPYA